MLSEPRRYWVYALTTSRPPAAGEVGLAGEPLQVVAAGGVAAVVGAPGREPRPDQQTLLRYASVIEALARTRPALIPVRFGTRLDLDELRFVLGARRAVLRAQLADVRHRVQMNVHVVEPVLGSPDGARAVRARRGPVDAAVRGTAYLQHRAAEAARAMEVAAFAPVRHAVRRWVRSERVERRGSDVIVYHLVPRGDAEAYRRRLERAAGAEELPVRVSGPWAPYAFVGDL